MKIKYFCLCESVKVDPQKGFVSLINIITDLYPPVLPLFSPTLSFAIFAEKEGPLEPDSVKINAGLFLNQKPLGENIIDIVFQGKDHTIIVTPIQGIPITEYGVLYFEIDGVKEKIYINKPPEKAKNASS